MAHLECDPISRKVQLGVPSSPSLLVQVSLPPLASWYRCPSALLPGAGVSPPPWYRCPSALLPGTGVPQPSSPSLLVQVSLSPPPLASWYRCPSALLPGTGVPQPSSPSLAVSLSPPPLASWYRCPSALLP